MGLDTSHDAWHGAYSAFMRWREKIAELGGWPPLSVMEGFCNDGDGILGSPVFVGHPDYAKRKNHFIEIGFPLSWDMNPDRRLIPLLTHSDCDGELSVEELKQIVPALEDLLPKMEPLPDDGGHIGDWYQKTKQFVDGCKRAIELNEPLGFH